MTRCRSAIAAALIAGPLLLTGCSQSQPEEAPDAGPSATGSDAPASAPKTAGDKRACDEMDTVMAKMAVAAVHWRPQANPFDRSMATKVGRLAKEMSEAEGQADTAAVRTEIRANTKAYSSLAKAMAGDDRTHVFDSVGQTQLAYQALKQVCPLG